MKFCLHDLERTPALREFAGGLEAALSARGHTPVEEAEEASLVFNFFPPEAPESYRRRARSVFVVGVTEGVDLSDAPLERAYPLLIRSLSNLLVVSEDSRPCPDLHFLTPEQGHYTVSGAGDDFFRRVYRHIEPLASSTLVIDNRFEHDLPAHLRSGTATTRAITRAGRRLDALDLLPAPFPLREVLPEEDRRHLKHLFGIGGLSYGNVSARHAGDQFWMSASGVDKSQLEEIGREILLVKGYDSVDNAMVVSVPPGVEPRRVSVDAIEHWMIYRQHPGVGAVVHVHAWMEGVTSTDTNYPCGTRELGEEVARHVREAPDPTQAVVGLKNHGLTITGRSLDGIFERIKGRLQRTIPSR